MHAKNLLAYFPCKTHFCRHFIHLGLGGSQFGETNGFEENDPGQKGKNHYLYCGILYKQCRACHVGWCQGCTERDELFETSCKEGRNRWMAEWQEGFSSEYCNCKHKTIPLKLAVFTIFTVFSPCLHQPSLTAGSQQPRCSSHFLVLVSARAKMSQTKGPRYSV